MAYVRLSFFISVVFFSTRLFAQQTESLPSDFGSRHAKIPHSPADTGILFDEFRLEQAAQDYWDQARFSGDNAGKTKRQLENESFNAIHTMENRIAFKSQSLPAWQQIGGSQDGHASGRIRSVAFDGTKTVYIAAASGGIWKTTDITANPVQWINLSDRLPTCNFGSIAVDPKRTNIIYAGTGESQGDNYREQISGTAPAGTGLYKSVDGGLNWVLIDSSAGGTAPEGPVCSQIVIDPVTTDNIYVATGSNYVLKSVDGGSTWTKSTVSGFPAALSIAIDPVNTNNLYVSGFGSIFRSTNSGGTWVKCTTGLPGGDRITVALAPSAPNTIYASIGTTSGAATLGVWVSDDYGVTWRKQFQYTPPASTSKNQNPLGMQEQWCNSIVVHPTNPSLIFVAGLDIYSSSDSGKDLIQRSNWTDGKTQTGFVHADIHFLTFNGNTLYACTDGGLASAQNPFTAWNTSINKGIATLQFVGVDANKEFTYVTGGCQDNSTNQDSIQTGGAWGSDFHETIGGDGGHAWVSQEQGNIAYTTYVYANFKQSLNGGLTWSNNLFQAGVGPLTESPPYHTPFYTVYDCSSDGSVIALGGNSHVWVSTSGGTDGFPNKSNVGIGNSFAIHVAPADASGSTIWAASGGNIYRTVDQGTTWVKQTGTVASTVTGITSDPNNAMNVYACTTSGKHFFKSTNGGVTFDTVAKNLPNIPCWSIAFNPKDGKIFVGTEKGVFFSGDGGVTWAALMNGMPYAMVTQLRVRGTNNDKLLAGTYGRGMFWLDISNLQGVGTQENSSLSLDPVIPNPVTSPNAAIGFTLKAPGLATITLHDILGRELRILDKSYYETGKHQISFAKENLSAGSYFIMLTANGKSVSQKIVVE